MKLFIGLISFLAISFAADAQTIPFGYDLKIVPKNIPNFPGVHSFAYGQSGGKWVIIGGRRDGLHARQPNSSFPAASNNSDIFVIDPVTEQFWSAPVNALPTGIAEQLQSTNMNFHQDADTLYIIGGYAYSATNVDHITFPNLTSISVSGLINSIISGASISPYFKQITNQNFAVTGGHLAHLDGFYYLVGGHRFDGRYNPMGNATYVQTYVDGIRKFKLNNSGNQLSYSNYSVSMDQVNLHRRDYNLVPQIFPNGEEGFMISSGVFQVGINLPFLYPVEIRSSGHTPIPSFNQYLSNYHSPAVGLYDSISNTMHSLFFGGMSQYYYSNGTLVQDDAVPFVKTISRVSRDLNGQLQEVVFPNELPALLGAGGEFISNMQVPTALNEVVLLNQIAADSVQIGHLVGGIVSPQLNPFSVNNTGVTAASNGIYEVWLKKSQTSELIALDGSNPFSVTVFPNPVKDEIHFNLKQPFSGNLQLFVSDLEGRIVFEKDFVAEGKQEFMLNQQETGLNAGIYTFHFVFDGKFSRMEKVVLLESEK